MTQSDLFSASKQFSSLDEVLAALKGMKDDPLVKAGTNVVISRGNPNAKLLIIGEAPGPQENICRRMGYINYKTFGSSPQTVWRITAIKWHITIIQLPITGSFC